MTWRDVINGKERWSVEQGDLLEWLPTLPADSVDLVFGSPPYEAARTYGIDFKLRGQAWVDWMVKVYQESLRVCRGLVAFVLEGQTRQYRWSATPALLMADLHRAGVHLRKPPAFHRVGIPGSGGPDWLRNDYEFIVCATKGGKLPWSENTACGHTPKWAPGGEMSHRIKNGERRNEWGRVVDKNGNHVSNCRGADKNKPREQRAALRTKARRVTSGHKNGDTPNGDSYVPPVLANPGNVLNFKVGGGLMGHELAHENEAPFPLGLAELFVRSFAAPDSIVLDPFSGSGTTAHAAVKWQRRFIGCDVRQSQVDLTRRRIETVTPMMFDAT